MSTPIYRSNEVASDAAGNAVKFSVPTVANGQVFVGTDTEVSVYGLGALSTAVNEIKDPAAQLQIFPVPATTLLNVQVSEGGIGKQQLTVTNLLGQVVHQEEVDFTNPSKVEIDVTTLAPGKYILTMTGISSSVSRAFNVVR